MAVTLGLCHAGDVADLLLFLDRHWKRGHAFTVCRELLDWQHLEADGVTYSFVLARRDADRELMAILGFLPTRRFDPALTDDNTLWLTTWKVRDDAGDAGLGLRMLRFLTDAERHAAVGAITTTRVTQPIYARLGYRIGELRHYVLPNPDAARFDLAVIDRAAVTAPADESSSTLSAVPMSATALTAMPPELLAQDAACPRKTARYFADRYLRHPIYRYAVHSLVENATPRALMATRVAEHDGHRALRIVDYAGPPDAIARVGGAVRRLIAEQGAEYADIYNTGIGTEVFGAAGFIAIDPDGPQIVPDHFEPFERRNVRLWFSLKADATPLLFKGDADQDRPSIVAPV
jgi:hypothetical protein